MAIKHLEINRFRNLDHVEIEPNTGFNFITGDNGSGKTSLLEAMFCLGRGKSFRTHKTSKLIQSGQEAFTVVGKVAQRQRDYIIGMQRSKQGSQIRVSGRPIKSTAELTEILPIALLEPGLHRLIEEGPEFRRKYLDWGVFHVEPEYATTWKTYRRALEQRNAALRDRWNHKAIQQWDRELVSAAQAVDESRKRYLQDLKSLLHGLDDLFDSLPEVEIGYHSGWRQGINYPEYLEAQYESDRERGFTQYGPHRADLRLRIGGADARDVLSRGQQKLLVASLILAQCQQLAAKESSTVILVDDLPAELDPDRRFALMQALKKTGAQVFVTGTEMSLFEVADVSGVGVFHVKQGRLEGQE